MVTTMTTPGISELELLLADLESELVERKESFRAVADKVRETVSAFANDLPDHRRAGIVFIGGPTARQALARNGNPPPEFDVQPFYLGVVVRPVPSIRSRFSTTREASAKRLWSITSPGCMRS